MSRATRFQGRIEGTACLTHDDEDVGINISSAEEVRQAFLPPMRWQLQPDVDRFAHPAEVELARLLTFYGVRWAYEPTTFALRWGSDGLPEQFVTPDFYLPDHDAYLELTTMRQRLVTRKNRKFRLLRERYPNVRARILYLRDFERLQHAYSLAAPPREVQIRQVLFSEREVEARIAELAIDLIDRWQVRASDDRGERPVLLGIGQGSVRFLSSLSDNIRAYGVAVDVDSVDLTAMGSQPAGSRVRLARTPIASISGRTVVLVQEVLSTGLSAVFLDSWLRGRGAAGVEVCALLDRRAARILDVPVACRGFDAPDILLTGYGLTRWSEFRDLPFIAEVDGGFLPGFAE